MAGKNDTFVDGSPPAVDSGWLNIRQNESGNLITSSGQTLSDSTLDQEAKAVAIYTAVANFYNDSGSANSYVLAPQTGFKAPVSYTKGMEIRYRPANANTGASTVNVAGLGVKDIKLEDGSTDIGAGFILSTQDIILRFDSANDCFVPSQKNIVDASVLNKGTALLSKPIAISNNSTDSDHDIDFGAGNFIFDDGSGQAYYSDGTGQLDVVFGTGNGMLDAGSIANDTWYYLYMIYNPTTGVSKPLATTSYGSPTLPSGYTKKRYIAPVLTDGSANIRTGKFIYNEKGLCFFFKNRIQDFYSTNTTTTKTAYPFSLPEKSGIIASLDTFFETNTSGGARYALVSDPDLNAAAVSASNFNLTCGLVSGVYESFGGAPLLVSSNSSGELDVQASVANCQLTILTNGFIDNLL